MSREIKFRAWDIVNKRMVGVDEMRFFGNLAPHVTSILSGEVCNLYSSDFELMQYTGLKDKNGKDVFEGDIVIGRETSYLPGCIGQIKWCGLCFAAVGVQKSSGEEWFSTITTPTWSRNWDVEVIGNIYENGELLNG